MRREAKIDIPPMLRGEVWNAVVEIPSDTKYVYDMIDKDSEGVAGNFPSFFNLKRSTIRT